MHYQERGEDSIGKNPFSFKFGLLSSDAFFNIWGLRTLTPMEMPSNFPVTLILLLLVAGDVAVSLRNALHSPYLKSVSDSHAVNSLYCRTLFT